MSEEVRLILMSSGVTLSLVALLFSIRNRYVDTRKSLKVEHSTEAVIAQSALSTEFQQMLLTVNVLNSGKQPAFVHHVHVKLPKIHNGYDQYQLLDMSASIQFPYKIEAGDSLTIKHGLRSFSDSFESALQPDDKIRFFVQDTLGKRYYSKKVAFKDVTEHLKTEELLRQKSI